MHKFKDLEINQIFKLNGNVYYKKSTRTAYSLKYNKLFYIGLNERVEVTNAQVVL